MLKDACSSCVPMCFVVLCIADTIGNQGIDIFVSNGRGSRVAPTDQKDD